MKRTGGGGRTAKHTRAVHGKTAKHNPRGHRAATGAQGTARAHAVAKHPLHTKARRLTAGDVPCCTAEAVAASLRLSGAFCGPDDVLALYGHTCADADTGASILATLEAAREFGLAGFRPEFAPADMRGLIMFRAGLVLGLELPGPHAVTVAPDGCWLSWGEHYDPAGWPDAVVEEAWAVTWP